MYKTCSKCGKVHPYNQTCHTSYKRTYKDSKERTLRNTYAWEKKSKEIRERACYLCEYCKTKGIYTYEGLEVHHITKLKDDSDGLLNNNNLVCLCTACHKKADAGEIEPSILRQLAWDREQK